MENFNTIISQYLDFCKNNKNLNDKTLKSYLIDLEQFNDYISDNDNQLSKDVINKYIAHLQQNYNVLL